jgi:predicted nicotinamide N-methyase
MARTILVQIPQGAEAGDTLTFHVDGAELELQVPLGSAPGDTLEIQVGGSDDSVTEDDLDQDESNEIQIPLSNGVILQLSTTASVSNGQDNDNNNNDDNVNNDGTHAMAWPAGLEMSRRMDQLVIPYSNAKRILELGSGLGLVGLTFAATYTGSGPCTILLTDTAMPLLERNLSQNRDAYSSNVSLQCRRLTWGSDTTMTSGEDRFDLILASDVLYNLEYIPALVKTIGQALVTKGGTVLIAIRWRKPDHERDFFNQTTTKLGIVWTLHDSSQCRLSWEEYGNPTSVMSNLYFAQTMVAVDGKPMALADIDEDQTQDMGEDEYQAWERAQIQIYIGKR